MLMRMKVDESWDGKLLPKFWINFFDSESTFENKSACINIENVIIPRKKRVFDAIMNIDKVKILTVKLNIVMN